jgi:hypothetical protein
MKIISQVKIHHMNASIKVRDIDIVVYNCFEYIVLKMFFSEFKEIAKFIRQTHVVNNLKAKFLMNMNILRFEEIIIDIIKFLLVVTSS